MSIQTIPRPLARPEPRLPSLHLVQTPRALRRVSQLLMLSLLALPIGLIFVPWQQNVLGMGRVVAYAPIERQQTLDARIDGRVIRWWVVEGSQVKQGDPIVEIADNDPNVLIRLREQRDATEVKLKATKSKLESAISLIGQFVDAGNMAVAAADQSVAAAEEKVKGSQQELNAAQVALETDTKQVRRMTGLEAEGLVSRRDRELAEQKYRESSAKRIKAGADLKAAEAELQYKKSERLKIRAEANAKIDGAKVYRQEAEGEVALARKDLSELEVKLARQGNQKVVAPRDGTVLRIVGGQDAEYVKAGDPLVVLIPESTSRAAEIWVDGNDAPLLAPGRTVRLQFEGWPAIQFGGWPSVAVGSFGGKVSLVDSTDDGKGKFRILVIPDPADKPKHNDPKIGPDGWPEAPYLRQGVRAKGWVLLDQVRLGYELWRRMNGFPQSVASPESQDEKNDKKEKPKRPK